MATESTWAALLQRESTIGKHASQRQQLALAAAVAVEVAVRTTQGASVGLLHVAAFLGFGLAAVAHVAARRGDRVTLWCSVAALANTLAFGLLRPASPDLYTGLLVLLPLLYLARLNDLRGAAYGAAAVLLLYLLPALALGAPDVGDVVALSAVGALLALFTGATSQAWSDDLGELGHQRSVVETLVQTVDVGLVLMDPDGVYQVVNPRHQEFIRIAYPAGHPLVAGRAEGNVFDRDRTTPLPRDRRPSARAAAGEEFAGEVIFVGPAGGQRALSVSSRAVRDEGGAVRGMVLAYHDVTDAMEALRVKDDFVALVSHELRTPLTSIMGYLDVVLEDEALPAGAVGHLEVAERNAQRLLKLVTDLLNTASAEQGTLEIVLRPTGMRDLVAEATEELVGLARQHGITVRTVLHDVPSVQADVLRMGQVVTNLVSNAIKYSSRGGEVQVRLSVVEDHVRLTVTDRGMGMDQAETDRAFSAFYRTSSVQERAIPGAGLGLTITRTIVQGHGGRIWLQSEEGVGTVATVELPTRDAPAVAGGPEPAGSDGRTAGGTTVGEDGSPGLLPSESLPTH